MKITSITVWGIRLPLIRPFIVAYETYDDMPTLLVKVETDTGIAGYGEATPDQHVTGETWESAYSMLVHQLGPLVIGEDPFAIERIHERMAATVYGAPSAKAAIDIACYDIMGKAAGQPVYNLLGGRYRGVMPVPYVVSILPPEEMAREAVEALQDGYSTIKIKVGNNPALDVERIRAVRKAIGEDVQLRVDANQGWKNRALSMWVLEQVKDCNIDWIEQPVIADDISAMAEIRRQIHIPVMIDEGVHGDREMRETIVKQAADKLNIKLMKCGGIYPALKLVAQAEMAGLECQVGSMVESAVATAAGAHLSAAKKAIISNELVGPLMFSRDVAPFPYEGKAIRLTERPGLGLEVDDHTLAELAKMSAVIA
ncbi:dipeptide epimerase [Brevibacillus brevis]|uniref:Dipeptide epimerase n=1 Tax=Brevibacillus brevis TaxID=1393 RepID=A0ABY9T4B0_BREBE|nr:dipeptide epimerase [Brevibacillus brevis]WNC13797.1 dipeptide epimerase [Brevibacillus brevis]